MCSRQQPYLAVAKGLCIFIAGNGDSPSPDEGAPPPNSDSHRSTDDRAKDTVGGGENDSRVRSPDDVTSDREEAATEDPSDKPETSQDADVTDNADDSSSAEVTSPTNSDACEFAEPGKSPDVESGDPDVPPSSSDVVADSRSAIDGSLSGCDGKDKEAPIEQSDSPAHHEEACCSGAPPSDETGDDDREEAQVSEAAKISNEYASSTIGGATKPSLNDAEEQ